jgi:hypothetical protein
MVRAPKQRVRKSVISEDILVPGLDLDAAPAPRPSPITPEARARIHAEEKAAAETNVAKKTDRRGRPVMPRWPLITGILPFLFSPGVPIRWFMFTIVSVLYDSLAMYGLSTIGNVGGGFVGAGMGAIAGVCIMLIGLILCVVWLAGLSSTFFAIVTESSEGHDTIQAWPQNSIADWFPELFYFLVAIAVSGTPGALIARFAIGSVPYGALSIALSIVFVLPIVFLSQLDGGSAFSVLTPRILQSLLRCPFSWLLFYLETAGLVAICVGLALIAPPMAVTPVLVVCVLLYARLLGRLGWRLAEAMGITV